MSVAQAASTVSIFLVMKAMSGTAEENIWTLMTPTLINVRSIRKRRNKTMKTAIIFLSIALAVFILLFILAEVALRQEIEKWAKAVSENCKLK